MVLKNKVWCNATELSHGLLCSRLCRPSIAREQYNKKICIGIVIFPRIGQICIHADERQDMTTILYSHVLCFEQLCSLLYAVRTSQFIRGALNVYKPTFALSSLAFRISVMLIPIDTTFSHIIAKPDFSCGLTSRESRHLTTERE